MRALLCADLADSTDLVERMGDIPAAELIRRHDRVARDLMQHHGGKEIDKTDGFLLLFSRALDALSFALAYQRALGQLSAESGQSLRARVGIHLGEVLIWQNSTEDVAQGAKPVEVEGLAKPVAARLMGLALPGQILLSGAAFNLAQRAAGELGPAAGNLRWLTHGRYRFKGVPQAQLVHEVGEAGIAPLKPPPSGPKARRDAPLWRRPMALAIEAVAAAAVLALALTMIMRPTPVIAFAERDWVVLGDLQNRTGDASFESVLDTALRIGLEQSRFVNVVPNLQVQDGLRRMQKPGVVIDRAIGVELALREGARAVVVPSLSAVGKQLRFDLEVVDPVSGRSAWVTSSQAEGSDGLLGAMDQAITELRVAFGESMSGLQQTNGPLAKITTSNLDALRAYSRVDVLRSQGKIDDTIALLELAVSLDPEFALAHSRLGAILISWRNQAAKGIHHLQRAVELKDRASLKEGLIIEGMLAEYSGQHAAARDAWASMVALYPDLIAAHQNFGHTLLFGLHNPAAALESFDAVIGSSHPRRGETLVLAAMAHLRLGDQSAAESSLQQARSLGAVAPQLQDVMVDIALGNHEAAEQTMRKLESSLSPSARAELPVLRAAILLETDGVSSAHHLIDGALRSGPKTDWSGQKAKLALAELAFSTVEGSAPAAAYEAFIDKEKRRSAAEPSLVDPSARQNVAFAAVLALLHDHGDAGAAALDWIREHESAQLSRVLADLVAIGDCLQRQPLERIDCLLAIPEPILFMHHVARWRSALDIQESVAAARHAQSLRAARGAAFAELEEMDFLLPNLLALIAERDWTAALAETSQ